MQGKKREKFAVEACNFTVFMHGTCIYMYVGGVYIHGFYDTRGHTNVLVFHLKKYFCCTGTCFKRREDLRFSKVLLQVCLALYPPGIEATRLHTMIYCVCVCVCVCRALYFMAYSQAKQLFNNILSYESAPVHLASAISAGTTMLCTCLCTPAFMVAFLLPTGLASATATSPIWVVKTQIQLDTRLD